MPACHHAFDAYCFVCASFALAHPFAVATYSMPPCFQANILFCATSLHSCEYLSRERGSHGCLSFPCLRRFHYRLPRKEVIQPHLPVRLPCYDFVPVIGPTLGSSSLAVRSPTSGVTNSHDVTGGVYKARERIHRSIADLRLLATPASCRRVAAYNPNYERL
jgi:hypothetical protein